MRILHISDTHGLHHQINILNNIDVLVFTGDESNHRDPYRNEAEFYDFAQWFIDLPIKHKLFIVGNHSTYIFHNEKIVRDLFQKNKITWLHKSSIVIDGIKFYGDGISPRFGDWVYTTDRAKTNKHWDLIPEDTQVLLTHTPPKGILDISENRLHEIELVGDSALLKKVNKLPLLKAHLFGHIHNYKDIINTGTRTINEVVFSNATAVTDAQFNKGITFHGNIIEI